MSWILALALSLIPTAGWSTILIYSSIDAQEVPVYVKAFKDKTGIDVKWVRLSAGETIARMEAEKKNPQATVWFGAPSPEFITAKKKGLLEAYKPTLDYDLKASYRDKDWAWTGIYFGAIAFAVNEKYLEKKGLKAPETWEDLLKPEFKGQISMAYPYTSGTAFTIVSGILQKLGDEKGWDYLKKLDGQIHHYNKSGSAAVTQVGLGEVAVGITFSQDIMIKGKSAGYPVAMFVPKDGTTSETGGVALIKGGKNPEIGKQFIDFYVSKEGQEILKKHLRVPLHPQVAAPEGAAAPGKTKLIAFNPEKASDQQKEILDKWRRITAR